MDSIPAANQTKSSNKKKSPARAQKKKTNDSDDSRSKQSQSSEITDANIVIAKVVGQGPKIILQDGDMDHSVIRYVEVASSILRKISSVIVLTNIDGKY